MTDAELGKLVHATFEEVGFAETIRERLRTAAATVIADRPRVRQSGTSAADMERRATAFRLMAGVGL